MWTESGAPRRGPEAWRDPARRLRGIGAVVAAAVLTWALAVEVRALVVQTTWYLSLDQFAYLTFARDLLAGRVFHGWPPLAALADLMPHPTDVLAQTYVWDGARLFCRYAPGFPLLLAAWIGLFGEGAAFLLNPIVFAALVVVAAAVAARLGGSVPRGVVVALLVLLCPTRTRLWALTIARDLSVHLAAFGGLLLLLAPGGRLPGRWRGLGAGLLLGMAVSIRPDAVLYLPAAAAMAWVRWPGRGDARGGGVRMAAVGLFAGALPLFTYNAMVTGNPLRMTQGMEVRDFLRRAAAPDPSAPAPTLDFDRGLGFPPAAWRGGTHQQVQGGGLRLANVPRVAPRLADMVWRGYGVPLLVLAALGLVVAAVVRPALAVGAVVYGVPAFLFYSCWARPDPRYLVGVFVFVPMLIVEGVLGTPDLLRRLREAGREDAGRVLALVVAIVAVVGLAGALPGARGAVLPWLGALLAVVALLGVVATRVALDAEVVGRTLALGLVLVLGALAVGEAARAQRSPAPFGERASHLARMNVGRLLEDRAVVITSEDVGRPAENIEYYGGGRAAALYLTDLRRWRIPLHTAALRFVAAGMRPFLYLPPTHPHRAALLRGLRNRGFVVERIATIPPRVAMVHFVATQADQGVAMELHRIAQPRVEERLRGRGASEAAGGHEAERGGGHREPDVQHDVPEGERGAAIPRSERERVDGEGREGGEGTQHADAEAEPHGGRDGVHLRKTREEPQPEAAHDVHGEGARGIGGSDRPERRDMDPVASERADEPSDPDREQGSHRVGV